MTVETVLPSIYVVEWGPALDILKSRWVVIAMTGFEAAEIVAQRVMPKDTLEHRKSFADTLDVSRLGTYDPGTKGSRFGAVVSPL